MTTPSTANSRDAGTTVRPALEKGAAGPSATHSVVKGEAAPRLPHERDESSDSGTVVPNDKLKKAAHDVENGRTDVQRGPQTEQHYSDLTGQSRAQTRPR